MPIGDALRNRQRQRLASARVPRQVPAMRRIPPFAVTIASLTLALVVGVESSTAQVATPVTSANPNAASYSDSQADVGRRWFAASCEECHALNEVSSADFRTKWGGRTAFDLFDIISRTMPEAEPGSLPRRAYVDIVAYLMKQNGVAAAAAPLADDDAALTATILKFAAPSHARR
jgi:mono/diheme cytochrome c family protein